MIIRYRQSHKSFLICNISKLQYHCSTYLTYTYNYFYTMSNYFSSNLVSCFIYECFGACTISIRTNVLYSHLIFPIWLCTWVFFISWYSFQHPVLCHLCIYLNGWMCIFNGTESQEYLSSYYPDVRSQCFLLVAKFRSCRKGGAGTEAAWEIEARSRS